MNGIRKHRGLKRYYKNLATQIDFEKTRNLESEFQLYAVLLDFDSYSDALFLHTPNPNNSQFPFKIEDLHKTTTLSNQQLNDYINNLDGYEKLYGKADEAFCLIYKKNVGQPFG